MVETPQNSPDNACEPTSLHRVDGWTHSVFFRTHSPRLEALIRSRLSRRFQQRFDPEDVVQSAFRSFFLRQNFVLSGAPSRARGDESDLWPLLAEIAVRKLSQQIRRHSAQRRNVAADAAEDAEIASTATPPDEAASLSEIVKLAQSELDGVERRAFSLRLDGFEILEIAEQLAISERTVRRHLSVAKQSLVRLLEIEPPRSAARKSSAKPADVLPTDLTFDDYRLHEWIGDGAVGNVYRATEKSSGRTVAVKFLKKAFRFHPQAVASFQHEVQIVSHLNHPGIVRITGMGRAVISKRPAQGPTQGAKDVSREGDFLVMDWASGGDLARYAAAHQPALATIRQWSLELTEALQHAHQHGVIHCDLKPSNILIGPSGNLQVSDFGLARQQLGWSDSGGSQGGTPAFIAPELVDPCWGPVGPWTDVFGLGAVMYNLLTGKPVHQGATVDAILASIVGPQPVAWPMPIERTIPVEWRIVCDHMLSKRVNARYSDMISVKQAIEGLPVEV